MVDYGAAVRLARTTRCMTQRDLAKAAGLNAGFVSFIENNQRSMTTGTLDVVAAALHIPVWALVVLGSDDALDAVRGAAMAMLGKETEQ